MSNKKRKSNAIKNEKVYKFKVNKVNWGLLLSFLLLSIFLYAICLAVENETDSTVTKETLDICKNTLVVIMSVLGTSLISVPLIETKNNNSLFSQMIVKDIFSSEEFIQMLKDSDQEKILSNLECSRYFNNGREKQEMFKSIREKITKISNEPQQDIYYEKCDFKIRCEVFEDRIEKHITKTLFIRSFNQATKINKFHLAQEQYGESNLTHIKNLTVKVGDDDYTKNIVTSQDISKKSNDIKSGYKKVLNYYIDKAITIPKKSFLEITISYVSTVDIDDLVFICRITRACKKFKFDYKVVSKTESKYKLNCAAFGFIDDACKTPNHNDDEPEICIEFNDWIFPKDGVYVTMVKNN